MGNLTKLPLSEITATLEVLEKGGVVPELWGLVRSDKEYAAMVAEAFRTGLADYCRGTIPNRLLPPSEPKQHVIDCDAPPFVPSGWKVEAHKKGGQFLWDHTKVILHLSAKQQGGKVIQGHELRKELTNLPVLNACVLDYLLVYPELIPEEWKRKQVFFWGTVYRDSNNYLYVRCLYWSDSRWDWRCDWLSFGWGERVPAALVTSVPT